MSRFFRVFLMILFCALPAFSQTATVNWTSTHQTMQGFGAGNNFTQSAMNPYDNLLFNTLGYSLLRSAVPLSNGVCDGSPSAGCATAQDSVTDMQSCVTNGCRVWVYVSNPPGEYNSSGTFDCTVNPALNPASYAPFATYITNFVASLRSFESVPPYAVSAQNEPDNTNACQMSAAQMQTFIKNNLGPTMASGGQSSTLIMMPETEDYGDLTSWAGACMADGSCSPYVGVTAFHNYGSYGTGATPPPYSRPLWETEVQACCGVPAPSYTWDPSINDALFWATMVHAELSSDVNAWHYFWYVDNDTTYGNDSQAALINPAQSTPIAKRTYAIANWAKFVRPGWVRIDSTSNPQSGVYVTAFQDTPSGSIAIVVVNSNGSPVSQTVSITNAPGFSSLTPWITSASLNLAQQSPVSVSANSFSYVYPASSVTTFVGASTAPPSVTVSPTSISFGNVVQHATSAGQAVMVSNPSGGSITVTGASFVGTNASDFSVLANNCGVVPNGTGCNITVVFTPTSTPVAAESATMQISFTGAPGSPLNVALSGTSTSGGTGGAVTLVQVQPSTTGFCGGSTNCALKALANGTSAGDGIVAGVRWNLNSGTGAHLVAMFDDKGDAGQIDVTTLKTVVGPDYPEIGVESGWIQNVTAGAKVVTFVFNIPVTGADGTVIETTPLNASPVDKTAVATGTMSNGTNPPTTGAVTTTSNGELAFSETTIDDGFGSSSAFVPGAGWTLDNNTGGGSFDAASEHQAQSSAGSITANYTSPGNRGPWVANLMTVRPPASSGTVTLSPSSMAFGNVVQNTQSPSQAGTLTNSSGSTITITGVSFTGPNASDFIALSNTCTVTVANSSTCAVNVVFTPTATPVAGESATLQISFTGAPGSPLTISLSGTSVSGGGSGSLANIYYAALAQGAANGASCTSAYAYNDALHGWSVPGMYGTGANQIGPDTHIHVCNQAGNFVGAAGSTIFMFQGGGTSGHPILFSCDNPVTFTAPYWAGNPYGAIAMAYNPFITLDGTNCTLTATANGTFLANHTACYGITGSGNNETVINWTITNFYVRVSGSSELSDNSVVRAISLDGANDIADGNTIDYNGWAINMSGTADNAIARNNTIQHSGHGATLGGAHWYFYGNHVYNFGVWDNPSTAGTVNTSGTSVTWVSGDQFSISTLLPPSSIAITDAMGHYQNYNVQSVNSATSLTLTTSAPTVNGALYAAGDAYHQDGLHCFAGDTGNTIVGYVYNNRIDGTWGANMNQPFFLEQGDSNTKCFIDGGHVVMFNNVEVGDGFSVNTGFNSYGGTSITTNGDLIVNNLAVLNNPTGNAPVGMTIHAVPSSHCPTCTNIFENNAISSTGLAESTAAPTTTFNTMDYNAIENCRGVGFQCYASESGATAATIAAWRTITAGQGQQYETHGIANEAASFNAYFQLGAACTPGSIGANCAPTTNSPLLNSGVNLFSTCNNQPRPGLGDLCFDILGNTRPSSGPWTIGPYQAAGGPTAPAPPTGLIATVQ